MTAADLMNLIASDSEFAIANCIICSQVAVLKTTTVDKYLHTLEEAYGYLSQYLNSVDIVITFCNILAYLPHLHHYLRETSYQKLPIRKTLMMFL